MKLYYSYRHCLEYRPCTCGFSPTALTLCAGRCAGLWSASSTSYIDSNLPTARFRKHFFDYFWNFVKTDSALQKRRHCHFVGGVECNRFRAPCLRRFVGQTQTREFFHVRRAEIEVP